MLNTFENKPWQLTGETTAKSRPQDSLLEEFLQFDHTTRQGKFIAVVYIFACFTLFVC